MKRFSQRYGYTPLEKAIVRECMPEEIVNSLCTVFDILREVFYKYEANKDHYKELEKTLWLRFLNKRFADFYDGRYHQTVATRVLEGYYDGFQEWYHKLDMVELTIRYLVLTYKDHNKFADLAESIVNLINDEFERHSYGYRIVDNQIVEITSEEEIKSIESAISDGGGAVNMHLSNALKAYAQKPKGDYSNSIKESISAVEALCREMTGEITLGKAIKAFESKGIISLPKVMKEGLDKIYAYTNQPTTGIRHALMENDEKYVPGSDEAKYMLVVCSAFINYIKSKSI